MEAPFPCGAPPQCGNIVSWLTEIQGALAVEAENSIPEVAESVFIPIFLSSDDIFQGETCISRWALKRID